MARYRITYTSYPSSKAATSYSKDRASSAFYLGGIMAWLILGSIIWYIYELANLFNNSDVLYFFISLINILGMSWFPLYFFEIREQGTICECKKIILRESSKNIGYENIKPYIKQINDEYTRYKVASIKIYFAGFIPAFITGTFIVWFIESIYYINTYGGAAGVILLIVSILVLIGCVLFYTRKLFPLLIESTVKKAKKSNQNKTSPPVTKLICKYCGNYLDSAEVKFCRYCGKPTTSTNSNSDNNISSDSSTSNNSNGLRSTSIETELRKLKQLQNEGLITQEDYDAKKRQILKL